MKNINFESENLIVDWISLNITGLIDQSSILEIANYLSTDLRFNSKYREGAQKNKFQNLIFKSENLFEVRFIKNPQKHWNGTTISFSGSNANYFYRNVNWNIFDLKITNLGRFDLKYFREEKFTDSYITIDKEEKNVKLFMINSCEKILKKGTRKYAKWEQNNKGLILRIGQRASDNYFRVYQTNNFKNKGLSFELEIKRQAIKGFQELFFSNQIEEFENQLSKYFYKHYLKVIIHDSCYADWLLYGFRKIEPVFLLENQKTENYLTTTYLENVNFTNKEEFYYKLFQFLSFIEKSQKQKQFLGKEIYYIVNFKVTDFGNFIGEKKTNYYQFTKVLKFLEDLQKLNPIVKTLFKKGIKSSIAFPHFEIEKKGKYWIANIFMKKEFYNYFYPFYFPNSFLTLDSKKNYELITKVHIIKSISTLTTKKVILVEDILNMFSLSNSIKKDIKKLIIKLINELKEYGLIEPQIKLITKSNLIIDEKFNVDCYFTPSKLGKIKFIHLFESTNRNF